MSQELFNYLSQEFGISLLESELQEIERIVGKRGQISDLAKEIYDNNVAKGFWDENRNIGEMLMLVVSELSEALEADRKVGIEGYNSLKRFNQDLEHHGLSLIDFHDKFESVDWIVNRFETKVKNSFEDEIADAIIRLLDISHGLGIDIETHIQIKLAYNKTRPFKHGKKY